MLQHRGGRKTARTTWYLLRPGYRGETISLLLFFDDAATEAGRHALIWVMSCLLLLGLACGPNPDTEKKPRQSYVPAGAETIKVSGRAGGSLVYALVGEPDTFNSAAAADTRSTLLAYLTTGTLLEFDPVTHKTGPGVAQILEYTDDGRAIRLGLRDGLHFSDGVPLSAEDVLFTFRAIYHEESRNSLKDSLLVDGQPFVIEPAREGEFVIRAPSQLAAFEYLLASVPVLPRHCFPGVPEKPIEEFWTLDTPPERMAGLGPFRIARHEPGIRTVLRANPHYWRVDSANNQLPYLDEVELRFMADRNARVLSLSAGELDILDQWLRPEDFLFLEGREDLETINAGPSGNLIFFWFNLNPEGEDPRDGHEWFESVQFRQAVSIAISRDDLVQNVYSGLASPARTLVSAAHKNWYSAELAKPEYDPVRAREILREAGFKWEGLETERLVDVQGKAVQFELLTRSDETLGKVAAVVQQDLAKLGIEVSLRQEAFRTVISRVMRSRDYDSALMGLDIPLDPSDINNLLMSSGAMHVWAPLQERPARPWEMEIDRLMVKVGTTVDSEQRFLLFRRVQEIVVEHSPLIPLVNRNVLVIHQRSLKNLRIANSFPYALSHIWQVYKGP